MIARAFTTLGIWGLITGLGGILAISTRITTTTLVEMEQIQAMLPPSAESFHPVFETTTTLAPDIWLVTVGVLVMMLIIAGIASTAAIWARAWQPASDPNGVPARINAGIASAKHKRDQQARIKRLLERMDDQDVAAALDALESDRLADDGERVSVGDLLAQGRRN
jgi:hypothetical protein